MTAHTQNCQFVDVQSRSSLQNVRIGTCRVFAGSPPEQAVETSKRIRLEWTAHDRVALHGKQRRFPAAC